MLEGCFKVFDLLPEFLGQANLSGERHRIASGTKADPDVAVVHGLAEDVHGAQLQTLEFLVGELGGFCAKTSEFLAEVIILQPPVEGRFTNAGGAGGLSSIGESGQIGKSGQLPRGERGCLFQLAGRLGFAGTQELEEAAQKFGVGIHGIAASGIGFGGRGMKAGGCGKRGT